MRALRAQWRLKAEAADALGIYSNVLEPLTREFPHSHVTVKPSFTVTQVLEVMVPGKDERSVNAKLAFATGPGFEAPVIRRPDGSHWIVGDVLNDSAAAKAGITPGWKILSATNTLESRSLKAFCSSVFEPGAGLPTIKFKFELEPKPSRQHFEVKQLAEGVTYVRFDLFGEVGEPEKVIAAIDSAGPRGRGDSRRFDARSCARDSIRRWCAHKRN
jgi:carboxyl-terminal processing protease